MAVNKFDSPAQDRYFNTYVPLPYEQMMPVAAARLSQLQRGQDALNKTYEDTANLEYIPGGPDEAYIKEYTRKTNDLVQKYIGQDLSDPIVGGQLRSEFRKMTNPQHIKNIQDSKQAWATNQKLRANRIAEGSYDEYYDKDPAAGWDTVGTGKVYDYITPGRVNEAKIADEYFNTESITKGKTLSPRGDYNMHGTTESMTNAVADENWQNFSNQPGIPRFIDKLIDQKGLDKNDPKVRQQVAQEYLRSIGKSHTWDQQGSATLDAQVRAAQEKKGSEAGSRYTTTTPPIIPRKADPLDVGKMNFDANGNVKELEQLSSDQVISGYGAMTGTTPKWGSPNKPKTAAENKAVLQGIKEKIPQLKGLKTDEEVYKAYNELSEDIGSMEELPLINIGPKAQKGLAFEIASNLKMRSMYIDDEFGSTDLANSQDDKKTFLEDIGWTSLQLKNELEKYASGKESSISVMGIAPGARKSGMMAIQVYDASKENKGKLRTLYVDTNNQVSKIFSPSQKLYSAQRNLQSAVVPVGFAKHPTDDKKSITMWGKVTPDIYKDAGSGRWKYNTKIEEGAMDSEGNFIPLQEGDYDSIIDTQMRLLRESGYVGSDVEFESKSDPYAN